MSHFANDVHHRLSTRIRDIVPDFVESEYPAFVSFLQAYYEFLEQYDDLPIASTYTAQNGVVTVQSGNSTITGANTLFANTSVYANNTQIRVGADQFRIRSIANNTQLTIYDVPVRSYFANTHTVETDKSNRQASGAARQMLTIHDVEHTLSDFVSHYRDTYLRDIPQGLTDTKTLLPRILDFYQSRGSEASYQFLFRSLYGKEVAFSYPRESVFTTSDNEYVRPLILRLGYDTDAAITGNVALLETREIVGLTSNVRATVLQTAIAYEGDQRVVRTFISDPVVAKELGGILLEDGSGQLSITKYGIPPEGLASTVYTHTLVQEFALPTNFIVGETVSTIPVNDPLAITGNLVGSIVGFTINTRGGDYQIGDMVYPPSRYANGSIATGGFGGSGRISAFTDVDITSVSIDDAGLGYYAGLPLIVDNTGTGGGFGLSGYVSSVSPGNITLHNDDAASIDDGDVLTFVYETDGAEYQSSREKIDYYQVGVSLSDIFGGLLLDDTVVSGYDGGDLVDEDSGRQLLQESAIVLNDVMWSSNISSAIYGTNLSSTIIGLTSNLSTFPVYVNGVRTEVGEVFTIEMESFGSGYVAGLPTISVQTPVIPTKDAGGTDFLTYEEIFGEGADDAQISVSKQVGQIGQVDVVTGGSGYSNVAFTVNSTTSTTQSGSGAELGLSLGAVSFGVPYFRNTQSFASADQHLQDVTKYQPFAYVMTVEEDLSRYATILRQLVHPAGGLLLPRQTITAEVDLASIITFGGMDLTLAIAEDPFADPPSLYTITITAPSVTIALAIGVGSNQITSSSPSETLGLVVNVATSAVGITTSAPDETVSMTTNVAAAVMGITTSAPNETIATTLTIQVTPGTMTLTNQEETEHLGIPLSASVVNMSAPTAVRYAHTALAVTLETLVEPHAGETPGQYENDPLSIFTVWDPNAVVASAPTAQV